MIPIRPAPTARAPRPRSRRSARLFGLFALLMMLALGAPRVASAATCTASISLMDFGSLGFLSTQVDSTASIQVTCQMASTDPSSTLQVCPLIGSSGAQSPVSARTLQSSGGNPSLRYGLYSDGARATPWGDLSTQSYPSITLNLSSGQPVSQTMTVYGRVFASQTPYGNDIYHDAPLVTLAYGPTACNQGASVTAGVITAQASVTPSCTVSASPLNFGTQGLLQDYVDGKSTVQTACTMGTAYTVTFGAGNGPGATPSLRYMTNGSSTLAYTLYTDAARSVLWTDTQGVHGTGTGTEVDLPVYARIPAQLAPPPGVYNDQVVVTISY